MPRKPGQGRTEYNSAWNALHPEAAKEHRRRANLRHMGEVGSKKRELYNLKQAANRRVASRRKKKAKEVAERLLRLASERAQIKIKGFVGTLKPNCI